MRFPVQTCYQGVVYICVYEAETLKNVIGESLESLCNISYVERHASNLVESEESDDGLFRDTS